MPERSLDVLVRILTEQVGEQKANEVLDEYRKSAGLAASASQELGQKEKEAAELTEVLHKNHRALHTIMHTIGRETSPELGHALMGALMGPIGLAVAVTAVFEGIRERIADTNKELDEMATKAADAFSGVKHNLFDAIRNEEFGTGKIDEFFKHIEDDANQAKKAIEDALAIAKAQESAAKKEMDAAEQLDLQNFKSGAEFSTMTSQQKLQGEQAIKDRYARQRADLEKQGIQTEFDASYDRMRQAEADLNQKKGLSGQVGPDIKKQIDSYISGLSDKDPLKQTFLADKAAGKVNYGAIASGFSEADAEAQLGSMRNKLGRDGQTGALAKGGDAERAKSLHDKYDAQIAAATDELQKANDRLKNPELTDSQRAGDEMIRAIAEDKLNRLRTKSGIDEADAAVKADEERIHQLQEQTAIAKATADAQKKLKESIEKAQRDFDAAWGEFQKTGQIADINTGSVDVVTAMTAAKDKMGLASKIVADGDPRSIIEAGGAAENDLTKLARMGYTQQRITADYNQEERNRQTGGAYDQGAIDRFQRFAQDREATAKLDTLFETISGGQKAMIDIIGLHHRQFTSQADEIKALKNAFENLHARLNTWK